MSLADNHPIMMGRLECPASMRVSVDEWMPKHLDDSLAHSAVVATAYYEMIRDFATFPSALNGHGNRMVIYATTDVAGCLDWLDSPEIRAAIEDGVERESSYPLLEDEPFTGNVYEVKAVRGSVETDFIEKGWLYAERFDVPPAHVASFDTWLGEYLEKLARWPGAVRARSWWQYRDAPQRFPFDRYRSKGNRMVSIDFSPELNARDLVTTKSVVSDLAESLAA